MGRRRGKASNSAPPFLSLPIDIQESILSYLTPQELCLTSQVSKHFHSLSNSDIIWRSLFLTSFPHNRNYLSLTSRASLPVKTAFIRIHKALQGLHGDRIAPSVHSIQTPHKAPLSSWIQCVPRPDGSTLIATGSEDRTTVLTQYKDGAMEVKRQLRGHRAQVHDVVLGQDMVVTSSLDGSIRIHDISGIGAVAEAVEHSDLGQTWDDPPLFPLVPNADVAPLPNHPIGMSPFEPPELEMIMNTNNKQKSRRKGKSRRRSRSKGKKATSSPSSSSSSSSQLSPLPLPPSPPPSNSPLSVGESSYGLRSGFGKVVAVINGPKDGDDDGDVFMGSAPSSPRTPRRIKDPAEDVLAETCTSSIFMLEERGVLVSLWTDGSLTVHALPNGGLLWKAARVHGVVNSGSSDELSLHNVFEAPNSLVQPLAPTLMGAFVDKTPPSAATEPTSLYALTGRKNELKLWNLSAGAVIWAHTYSDDVVDVAVLLPSKWWSRPHSHATEVYCPPPIGSSWIEPGKRPPSFPAQDQSSPDGSPPPPPLPAPSLTPFDPDIANAELAAAAEAAANPPPQDEGQHGPFVSVSGLVLGVGNHTDAVPLSIINAQEPLPIEDQILIFVVVEDALTVAVHRTYETGVSYRLPRSPALSGDHGGDTLGFREAQRISSVDCFDDTIALTHVDGVVSIWNAYTGEQLSLILVDTLEGDMRADTIMYDHNKLIAADEDTNLISIYSLPDGGKTLDFRQRMSFNDKTSMFWYHDTGMAFIGPHNGNGADEVVFVDFTRKYVPPVTPWKKAKREEWMFVDDGFWAAVWTLFFFTTWSVALYIKLSLELYNPLWSLVNLPLVIFGGFACLTLVLSSRWAARQDTRYRTEKGNYDHFRMVALISLLLILGPAALSIKADFFATNPYFLWTYALLPWHVWALWTLSYVLSKPFSAFKYWQASLPMSWIALTAWLAWSIFDVCISITLAIVSIWADGLVDGVELEDALLPLVIGELPAYYVFVTLIFTSLYPYRKDLLGEEWGSKLDVEAWEWDPEGVDQFSSNLIYMVAAWALFYPSLRQVYLNAVLPEIADWNNVISTLLVMAAIIAIPLSFCGVLRARQLDKAAALEDEVATGLANDAMWKLDKAGQVGFMTDIPVDHDQDPTAGGIPPIAAAAAAPAVELLGAGAGAVANPVVDDSEEGDDDDDDDDDVDGAILTAPPPPPPPEAPTPPELTQEELEMIYNMLSAGVPLEDIQADLPPGTHIPTLFF